MLSARSSLASERSVVAVMEVEDGGAKLDGGVRARMSEYLATLAAKKHQVVPREQLGERPGKILTTRVTRDRTKCTVASRLFEAGSEGTAVTAVGGCSEEALRESIMRNAVRLVKGCSERFGVATIGSKPWARVFVEGHEIGTTPINIRKLPSGCALDLRLVAADGRERDGRIELEANKAYVYRIDFDAPAQK
jgi:hypothetical protein